MSEERLTDEQLGRVCRYFSDELEKNARQEMGMTDEVLNQAYVLDIIRELKAARKDIARLTKQNREYAILIGAYGIGEEIE